MNCQGGARIVLVSIALTATLAAGSACGPAWRHSALAGLRPFEEIAVIDVPGGRVNAIGGNLLIQRTDMELETVLGSWSVGASWNSSTGVWLWNHQITWDGSVFRDDSGAEHDLSALADESPVPGTHWTRVNADTVRTRGGLEFHFDGSGSLESVNWRSGAYPRLEFVPTANGIDIQQCVAPPVCYVLFEVVENAAGAPLSVTGLPLGRVATFEWDAWGRLVEVRDALDIENGWPGRRYEYEGSLLTAVTHSEGERVEYAYQIARRVHTVTQIGEGDPVHTFEQYWRMDGLYPMAHTNPLGGVTVYRADSERRIVHVDRPAVGELTTYTWADRRPASITQPSGETTTFGYTNDDLTSVVVPSGNAIAIQLRSDGVGFDAPLAPVAESVSDSIGGFLTHTFDAAGRTLTRTNGVGEARTFAWNPSSKLSSVTSAAGVVREYPLYGIHGQWLEMQGDASDRRSIDAAGNVLVPSVRIQPGGVLQRSFDADRNLSRLHVAATDQGSVTFSAQLVVERRSDGRIRSITRPDGAKHTHVFDALGRVILRVEFVDGALRSTSFEYDAAGHVTAVERPNGMRVETEWDVFGRVTRRRSLRDAVPDGQINFTFQAGRLATSTDSVRGTTETILYDAAGRVAAILQSTGERVDFEYDLRSRVTGEVFTLADQTVVADVGYAYDLANRRTQITDRLAAQPLVETTIVDGQIVEERFGNGLIRSTSFDPVTGRVDAAVTTDAFGAVVESTTLSHTFEVAPVRTQHRTTTTTPLATTTEEYWMGRAGNLTTLDGRVGSRVFGWNDGAGANRSWIWGAKSNAADTQAGDVYVYDAETERLLSATLPGEGVALTYSFDEAGFAMSRGGSPITWSGSGRMTSYGSASFEWDLRGRPVEIDDGVETREFALFGGRVESGGGIPGVGVLDLGPVSIALGASGVTYRHDDFRGNVSFASDETGAVVEHHHYAPFGRAASYGPGAGARTFEARREVAGLVLMQARMYDPTVGRFLSPDPVLQLVNQYAYAQGNPIDYVDANGAFSMTRAEFKAALELTAAMAAGVATLPATSVVVGAYATSIALSTVMVVAIMEIQDAAGDPEAGFSSSCSDDLPEKGAVPLPAGDGSACECPIPPIIIPNNQGQLNFNFNFQGWQ